MPNFNVGAGVLGIITESLYDNPIVVFREYVQNSIDSIFKMDGYLSRCAIKIWSSNNNLYFLDNGKGIEFESFATTMIKIGASQKVKHKNLGYKGIGRLSGVPYCKRLKFINIYDYANRKAQCYTIDSELYEKIKLQDEYQELSFEELMQKIGSYSEISLKDDTFMKELQKYDTLLSETNTGFLVILDDITPVLNGIMKEEKFIMDLQWLLPLDFSKELYNSEQKLLFEELTKTNTDNGYPSVRYCDIFYNDEQLYRPIQKSMMRKFVCKNSFKYAVGFHTFNGDKIQIDRNNKFQGIRIYIDNMLLCDEGELIQYLDHYGMLDHTANGQIQSVRGIGAMIYITDKLNVSANARRTFIEVTDNDSLRFLENLALFVNTIYDTRYALSNYASARDKHEQDKEKIEKLKNIALENLRKLAQEEIDITNDDTEIVSFEKMSASEKKREIKRKISFEVDLKIKQYLNTLSDFKLESAFEDFCKWMQND